MKSRPSFIMAAMALLAGGFNGASISAPTKFSAPLQEPTPYVPGLRGSGRTKRKVHGKPHGNGRQRKNGYRGSYYAAVTKL